MYAEKLLKLSEKLKNDEVNQKDFVENINKCFSYLNTQMLSTLEITMGNNDIVEIERLNRIRTHAHDVMCVAMNEINALAREKKVEKIFDFNLEPMTKNGRFAGYSQENHYKTAGMCAIMTDELIYLGRQVCKTMEQIERLEESVSDKVMRTELQMLDYDALSDKLRDFESKHFALDDILSQNQEKALRIDFRDSVEYLVLVVQDEYSCDILESQISPEDPISDFLSVDGTAYDVPKSVIKDSVLYHNGFNLGKTYDLQEMEEKTLDDVLKEVEQKTQKEEKANIRAKEYEMER